MMRGRHECARANKRLRTAGHVMWSVGASEDARVWKKEDLIERAFHLLKNDAEKVTLRMLQHY